MNPFGVKKAERDLAGASRRVLEAKRDVTAGGRGIPSIAVNTVSNQAQPAGEEFRFGPLPAFTGSEVDPR
ncbi:MAG: hypothetical protein R2843_00890 [Thermomicrobiales bacterium]